MASEFGRYLAVVGAAIACGVVTVLASTLIIDPYGISPISIDIPHVNDIKSPRNNLDRFVKPYDIIRMKPNTVIIGTSRVKQTFKPALIPEQFAPAYNAGTDALQMAEARELVAFIGRERVPVRNIWLEVFPLQFGFFPGVRRRRRSRGRTCSGMSQALSSQSPHCELFIRRSRRA